MVKRTFKVVDEKCADCELNKRCKISGIDRDKVFQSLANAKLYAWVQCEEDIVLAETGVGSFDGLRRFGGLGGRVS